MIKAEELREIREKVIEDVYLNLDEIFKEVGLEEDLRDTALEAKTSFVFELTDQPGLRDAVHEYFSLKGYNVKTSYGCFYNDKLTITLSWS